MYFNANDRLLKCAFVFLQTITKNLWTKFQYERRLTTIQVKSVLILATGARGKSTLMEEVTVLPPNHLTDIRISDIQRPLYGNRRKVFRGSTATTI